jgi:restriction system protein
MAIPEYQRPMLPMLKIAEDGAEHRTRDTIATLADQFGFTESERKQMLASGLASVFDDRFGWAPYYLKRAGLLFNPRRAYFQNCRLGFAQAPERIDVKLLRQFPEFEEF